MIFSALKCFFYYYYYYSQYLSICKCVNALITADRLVPSTALVKVKSFNQFQICSKQRFRKLLD